MVIIDTDIIVKCLKGEENFRREVSDLLENKLAIITPVQIAEVYAHTLSDEIALINAFFDLFEFIRFDRKISEQAGLFFNQYKKFYPELTISDCLVGAVAAQQEAEIYTMHPKHFPMTEVRLYHKTIQAITLKSKQRLENIEG
jgi:predicted nucleic acid-binding protein